MIEENTETLEDLLKKIDYVKLNNHEHYIPSEFAFEFINFIKLVNGEDGEENKSPVFHYKIIDSVDNHSNVLVVSFRGSSKALALDTLLMTPTGHVSMGDVEIGDYVLDRNGKPTKVTHTSEVFHNKTYTITLANGESFVANEDHTHILQYVEGGEWKEVNLTTKEMLKDGREFFIPLVGRTSPRASVEAVEPTREPVPSKCISVESDTCSYLIENSIVTHNTTLLAEYLFLYIAVHGEFGNFGKVSVAMYVGDTIENGVKNLRKNLEHRFHSSEFLQQFIKKARFTETEWEFENTSGHKLFVRGFGAMTGVRGFKVYGQRPQLACHARGTSIVTDMGEHLVEDYYYVHPSKFETGKKVRVCGLLDEEIVTNDHRYKCMEVTRTRHKKYNKVSNGVYTTSSTTEYSYSDLKWVEAKDLKKLGKIGNQQRITHYIAKPIDFTVGSVQPILQTFEKIDVRDDKGRIVKTSKYTTEAIYEPMLKDSFWWLYGLWLADGHRSENAFHFTVANTQKDTVGKKIVECVKDIGLHVGTHVVEKHGCYQLTVSSKAVSTWLKKYKKGISVKDMPKWVLQLPLEKQKQILLGYIAGDGYVDLVNNQVRINSVNLNVLRQLGVIAERLGLPYHIRNTKKAGTEIFPNGQVCNVRHQYEIRFRDNVDKVLGISITDNPDVIKQVFIEDGYIYRRVKSIVDSEETEFVPITTPSHEYLTSFGISHNCLDDLFSDKNASSPTIVTDIEEVIYKAVNYALHPSKKKIIWVGTPFNKRDPLYKAVCSNAWHTEVFPICQKFPCTRKEFVGAWEDRFSFDFVKDEFTKLKAVGKVDAFNQELMLRILSDEDRLVQDEDIIWYERDTVLNNLQYYNIYMTTDFATSETQKSDYSVISVWALDYKGVFHWIDGIMERQTVDKTIDDVFRFVELYSPILTGVEISGQQKGFVSWLNRDMNTRNIYFTLASDKTSGEQGIRPNTSKLMRFNAALPLFKQRKIAFPKELKEGKIMLEFVDEITSVTPSGFKSVHDDCVDTISQLPLLEYTKPSDPKYYEKDKEEEYFRDSTYFEELTPSTIDDELDSPYFV